MIAKGKQKDVGEISAAVCIYFWGDEMIGDLFSTRGMDENCIKVINEKA